jgi:hypothetical protein
LIVLLSGWSGALAQESSSVMDTVHNLSVTGPGEIRSLTETRVCRFCHVPHNAQSPIALWGRPLSRAEYVTPYLRTGPDAGRTAPQPDGSSRLCLSCHDGTVALAGNARNDNLRMTGGAYLQPGQRGFIGTDLSGSHPISFVVPDGAVVDPDHASDMSIRPLGGLLNNPVVRLDPDGKMQCTTCHDPHDDRYYQENQVPRFWVASTVQEVCTACHVLR